MSEHVPFKLLVIDDDQLFLEIAHHHLEKAGYEVDVASDPHQGVNRAIETHFDLILLDLMMPGLHGEEVLRLLKPLGGRQRILVVSGNTGQSYRSRARDLGAVGYLEKPVSADNLCQTVKDILESVRRSDDGHSENLKPAKFVDYVTVWVFGAGLVTPIKRLVAFGVVLSLIAILIWLITG